MSALNVILDEIDKRLNRISTANGDAVTIAKVTRARLKPFQDGDLPAVNYWVTQDSVEKRDYNAETHALSVTIEAYDKTRDRPFIDVAIDLSAGVANTLFREIANAYSPALGGIIQSLQVDSMQPVIGEGQAPWCGAIIELTIRYRTALGKTILL